MTFVWLTPLIILVLFLTVILYQDSVQHKSSEAEENRCPNAVKSGELDVSQK